jgi:signal transduction histidine kinase
VNPLLCAVLVFAAAGLQALLLTPPSELVTPIALSLVPAYSAGAHLPRRPAVAGLAICLAGGLALAPTVPAALIVLLSFGAGRLVRDRSEQAARLRDVNAELERAGDARAARARAEERLRVARELHDAVAHAMTVVVLQAGAAQRVWARDPAAARLAVGNLGEVARQTLAELRVTLRGEAPVRADALAELVARVEPLGLTATLRRDAGELPPEAEQVAYAVVQEALTNAARHAAPTHVAIEVRCVGDEALVSVTDAGRARGTAPQVQGLGTGTGLRGLAERLAAAGGTLTYGGDGPGFRVEARIPLRQAALA